MEVSCFAGADGRVVGQRLGSDAGFGSGSAMQAGRLRLPGQPVGLPGVPLGKRSGSWLSSAGKPQKVSLARGQRGELGDVFDGEAQAVVGGGAHGDRDRDRDVEDGDDEGEAGGFAFGLGDDREDRSGAEQVVRVAFVVGVDRDQPGLGVGRALVEGEVRGARTG